MLDPGEEAKGSRSKKIELERERRNVCVSGVCMCDVCSVQYVCPRPPVQLQSQY